MKISGDLNAQRQAELSKAFKRPIKKSGSAPNVSKLLAYRSFEKAKDGDLRG